MRSFTFTLLLLCFSVVALSQEYAYNIRIGSPPNKVETKALIHGHTANSVAAMATLVYDPDQKAIAAGDYAQTPLSWHAIKLTLANEQIEGKDFIKIPGGYFLTFSRSGANSTICYTVVNSAFSAVSNTKSIFADLHVYAMKEVVKTAISPTTGDIYVVGNGYSIPFVAKIDGTTFAIDTMMKLYYTNGRTVYAHDIEVTASGDVLVAGSLPESDYPDSLNSKAFVIKMDQNLNILTNAAIVNMPNNYFRNVEILKKTDNKGFYLIGSYEASAGDSPKGLSFTYYDNSLTPQLSKNYPNIAFHKNSDAFIQNDTICMSVTNSLSSPAYEIGNKILFFSNLTANLFASQGGKNFPGFQGWGPPRRSHLRHTDRKYYFIADEPHTHFIGTRNINYSYCHPGPVSLTMQNHTNLSTLPFTTGWIYYVPSNIELQLTNPEVTTVVRCEPGGRMAPSHLIGVSPKNKLIVSQTLGSNDIQLFYTGATKVKQVNIINTMGQTVSSFNYLPDRLSSSAFSSGIYYVRAITTEGEVMARFVRQ